MLIYQYIMPRVACFDVGGVLLGSNRPGLCSRVTTALGVPVDEVRNELNQHFFSRTYVHEYQSS